MSFAQIHRVFEAYNFNDEKWLRKFRTVAYEVWRKGSKNAPEINDYMPIGEIESIDITEKELDDVWLKYGKLEKGKRLVKLRRN